MISISWSRARQRWFSIVSLLLLVVLVVLVVKVRFVQTTRSRASGTTILRLTPGTVTSGVGETFSLSVLLDTKEDTAAAVDLVIAYDAAAVRAVGTDPSEQFPVVLIPGSMGGGTVHIILGTNPTSPQRGSVLVVTIWFEVLREGVTTIATTNESAVAAVGKPDNVLSQTYPATITIPSNDQEAGLLLSPSPSPSPIVTQTQGYPLDDGFLPEDSPSTQPLVEMSYSPTPTPTPFGYRGDWIPTLPADIPGGREVTVPTEYSEGAPWNYTLPKSPFPPWLDAIFQAITTIVCRVAPCT